MSVYELCRSMEDAQVVLNRMADPTTTEIVYDSETDGLDWRKNVIVGHVVTFGPRPQDTYYVPVRHGGGGNILDHKDRFGHPFERELSEIWKKRGKNIHMTGHNLQFDLMMLQGHHIYYKGTTEDTQVNMALLDEFSPSFSLDSCCQAMGAITKKGEELYAHLAKLFGGEAKRDQMANYWKLTGNDPIGVDYATGDGIATWDLRQRQIDRIRHEELEAIYHLERKVTRVVYRMMQRGIKVDRERLVEIQNIVRAKAAEASASLPKDFNPRSPIAMAEYLRANGVTEWPMTKPTKNRPHGSPNFNEAFLSTVEPGQRVLIVRKYTNLDNTFITPLLETHLDSYDRVHSTYHQMRGDDFGTVTGRFSSSGPNLQQVPKRNYELGKLFRSAFVPDKDNLWWSADLSQCEPRLLAHYSNAAVLVSGYLSVPPIDAHSAVAKAADMDREDGKRLNQTLLTGGGLPRIRQMVGHRAEEIYNRYFEVMPEIKILQKQAARRMRTRGYVISLLGRKARLDSPEFAYKAVNRLLQCGNADIIKNAMVQIDDHFESNGDTCSILNTVHDELSFQSPKDKKNKAVIMEALRIMTDYGPERSIFLRVPMVADYGIGSNWAEATWPDNKLVVG